MTRGERLERRGEEEERGRRRRRGRRRNQVFCPCVYVRPRRLPP
jgi:hypothetical protein